MTFPDHIHLIGIAGSAMTPLAGMLRDRGHRVTGSDTGVYPPASTQLDSWVIPWHDGYSADHLHPAPDLVVVGNAIPRGNPELEHVLDNHIPYRSLPGVLEEMFLPGHNSIVISGTHGKTTTTAMLAWLFEVAGRRPNFLVGGVAENFGRSYQLAGGPDFILEGDEYDTAYFDKGPKFLHYHPDHLIITSLEFDHADIYPDFDSVALQFRRLVNLVPRRGLIVAWGEAPPVFDAVAKAFCPVETYGLSAETDWLAGDLEFSEGFTSFRAARRGVEIARIRLPLVGRFNVLNALAAVAIAHSNGIERAAIEQALETFRSVRRRLEIKGEAAGVLVVEDFAHHPTAIRETLDAASLRWPGRRLWAVLEPRSNTLCRKVFEGVLPKALSSADAICLGPVHRPHLLSDDQRLSPGRVVESLRRLGRSADAFPSADAIVAHLATQLRPGDLVLVMSNGSFDALCSKLLSFLESRHPAGKGTPR